jgi:hypothetical protein
MIHLCIHTSMDSFLSSHCAVLFPEAKKSPLRDVSHKMLTSFSFPHSWLAYNCRLSGDLPQQTDRQVDRHY